MEAERTLNILQVLHDHTPHCMQLLEFTAIKDVYNDDVLALLERQIYQTIDRYDKEQTSPRAK